MVSLPLLRKVKALQVTLAHIIMMLNIFNINDLEITLFFFAIIFSVLSWSLFRKMGIRGF